MSKHHSRALSEARQVVSQIASENSNGKALQFEGFIQCLSEEIEDFWQPEIKEGLVHFRIHEDGNLIYEGLCTEMTVSPTDLYYTVGVLQEEITLNDVSDTQLDVFTLLSSMKESHFKQKSKILESLDQISADFDKKLIELIKKTKSAGKSDTTKVAEDYLNLDIATKKNKLLEKLLEGK